MAKIFLYLSVALSGVGFLLSLALHFVCLSRRVKRVNWMGWSLFLGMFITQILITCSFALTGAVDIESQTLNWQVVFKGCPDWLKITAFAFIVYGVVFVNVILWKIIPTLVTNSWELFTKCMSCIFIANYAWAFAILYSASRIL
jgi:hypothetical protein